MIEKNEEKKTQVGWKAYSKLDPYFLVIAPLQALAVDPDKIIRQKGISDHGHKVSIIAVLRCNQDLKNEKKNKKMKKKMFLIKKIEVNGGGILPSLVKAGAARPLFLISLVSSTVRPSIVVFTSFG